MAGIPYTHAVGALAYLAVATRPDIAYAVSVLAQFSANPGMRHWAAVKHLFRYIKGTMHLLLVYAPTLSRDHFTTYSVADHAGNPDNRSTSGMAVLISTGAASWANKLQTIVALSTTEAEYAAACSAGQEIVWLQSFFRELSLQCSKASQCMLTIAPHFKWRAIQNTTAG